MGLTSKKSPASAVPAHVAIVMDGNGRWAKKRLLPRLAGHRQGMETLRHTVRWCIDRGVRVLTVFAFSSENWNRPADEVSGLMSLMAKALAKEVPSLSEAGVRLRFPGDRSVLSAQVQAGLSRAEESTAGNTKLTLNVCFNYGGRWDIIQAARQLVARGEDINETSLAGALALAHVPDPDLLIRTGGEQRVSNFLLWQLAYTELYFSPCLWPAFDEAELDRALHSYAARERRFGRISEQLQTECESATEGRTCSNNA
jgi:undecaprenyl diphosphate synthase